MAIYIPGYTCLYTSDGLRIDNTCIYRRNRGQFSPSAGMFKYAPERIKPIRGIEKISRPIIYAGYIDRLFGHFLCESIARLWYCYKQQDCPILIYSSKGKKVLDTPFIRDIFGLSGLEFSRFVNFSIPVCFEEVIVPSPSFSLYTKGFMAHSFMPGKVAENLLSQQSNERTSQPLYFSRRKLSPLKRMILNEDKLEENLKSLGATIVYPEKLSFPEQVRLINKHDTLIGVEGSALHSIIFDISTRKNLVCFTESTNINQNCLMLDAINNVQSTYIAALNIESEKHKDGRFETNKIFDQTLDLDVAMCGLKMINIG